MIGLYVQHDTLRAVDIDRKSNGYVLNAAAEQPVHLPVSDRLRQFTDDEAHEYLHNFSASLQALLSVKGFSSKEIAIAIDVRNAFIHTVPFDGDFSSENIKRLIEWELHHYFPDIASDAFLFDTYNPGFNPAKDLSPKFIYTAVLRPYIHVLQRGVRSAGMKLLSINVDQFAIEKILKLATMGKKQERLNAVCFRTNDILYCSLLWNHRLVRYREYLLNNVYSPDKRLEMFLASLIGPKKNIEQRIYYHPFDTTITKSAETNTGWKFDRFKPFDNLQLTRKAKRNIPDSIIAQEGYAPAISVALNDK